MNIFEFFEMMYEKIHPNFWEDYYYDIDESPHFFEICRDFFEEMQPPPN